MKKVSFALSYMTEGVAGNWAESIYQDSLELDSKGDEKGLPTWEDFQKLFLSAFNPVNVGLEARNELRNLKQTGEADDYITRFRVLIGQSGIQEDISRIEFFKHGLKPALRRQIMNQISPPTTITQWYEQAATFDSNWRMDRRFEEQIRDFNRPARRSPPSSSRRDLNALDIDRALPDRDTLFKEGRCFKCGLKGLAKDCPKHDKKPVDRRNRSTSTKTEDDLRARIAQLEAKKVTSLRVRLAELEAEVGESDKEGEEADF